MLLLMMPNFDVAHKPMDIPRGQSKNKFATI
jgi:hypothetical protein